MNILMIYVEPTPYIIDLIEQLNRVWQGKIDIFFLYENKTQPWNMVLPPACQFFPARLHEKIRLAYRLFFKKKFALVHIAGWGERWFAVFILLAKCKKNIIVVESDTPLPHRINWCKGKIKQLVYPLFFRLIDGFLAGGSRQKKYFQYYGVADKQIRLMQMTVDTAYIQTHIERLTLTDKMKLRTHYQLSAVHLVFIFVGRLETYKGVLEMLMAFHAVQDERLRLLIVGDGSLRAQVEMAVQHDSRIHYLGRLNRDELIPLYHASDILILASARDHWGLVVNEAMAAGCPVIVSDRVGCVDDLVIEGETGFIIKGECVHSLQQAITQAASLSPEERLRMGDRARSQMAHWTKENEAKQVCKTWNQLIQPK